MTLSKEISEALIKCGYNECKDPHIEVYYKEIEYGFLRQCPLIPISMAQGFLYDVYGLTCEVVPSQRGWYLRFWDAKHNRLLEDLCCEIIGKILYLKAIERGIANMCNYVIINKLYERV